MQSTPRTSGTLKLSRSSGSARLVQSLLTSATWSCPPIATSTPTRNIAIPACPTRRGWPGFIKTATTYRQGAVARATCRIEARRTQTGARRGDSEIGASLRGDYKGENEPDQQRLSETHVALRRLDATPRRHNRPLLWVK